MQLIEEKRIISRSKKAKGMVTLLNSLARPDQLAIIKTMPVKLGKRQPPDRLLDFSSWNMPVQEAGVIKCRDHEFW